MNHELQHSLVTLRRALVTSLAAGIYILTTSCRQNCPPQDALKPILDHQPRTPVEEGNVVVNWTPATRKTTLVVRDQQGKVVLEKGLGWTDCARLQLPVGQYTWSVEGGTWQCPDSVQYQGLDFPLQVVRPGDGDTGDNVLTCD